MKFLTLVAGGLTLLSAVSCQHKQTETAQSEEQSENMTVQGVIELKTDTLDLSAYKGRAVVIDFNAVWCPPCREYGPIFHAVGEKMGNKAVFLSVNVDSCPTVARQYVGQYIPQTTLISPDRSVTEVRVGLLDETTLTALVDSVSTL